MLEYFLQRTSEGTEYAEAFKVLADYLRYEAYSESGLSIIKKAISGGVESWQLVIVRQRLIGEIETMIKDLKEIKAKIPSSEALYHPEKYIP